MVEKEPHSEGEMFMLKKSFFLLMVVLLITLLGCGGGGGSEGGDDIDNDNDIVGVWGGRGTLGEKCDRISMTIEITEDGNLTYSDDENGSTIGTYDYDNDTFCVDISDTNQLGCASPEIGRFCSDIEYSPDTLEFIDLSPWLVNELFYKIDERQNLYEEYIGYWTGNGINEAGEQTTVEVFIWDNGGVDYYLTSADCVGGPTGFRGTWGNAAYDMNTDYDTTHLSFSNDSTATFSVVSTIDDCFTITCDITKQSTSP